MKKKLFILLILLSIIFIPKNTFALSNDDTYVANNGITYNVDISNRQSILDYCFFTYIYPNSNYNDSKFILLQSTNSNNPIGNFRYSFDNITLSDYNTDSVRWSINYGSGERINNVNLNTLVSVNTTQNYIINLSLIDYSNITMTNTNSNSTFTANTSASDILARYPTPEPPTPEPPQDMTKEEIYNGLQTTMWVGCLLLATLILILFFKWTFPMKGGKKL